MTLSLMTRAATRSGHPLRGAAAAVMKQGADFLPCAFKAGYQPTTGAATMHIPDLESLEKARHGIEGVVSARYLEQQAVPYFAPTELGALSPTRQDAELRMAEENDQENVVRVSIHMCLASAVAALRVSEALLRNSARLTARDRARVLSQCSADMRTAATAALRASSVLAGKQSDPSRTR